MSLLQAAWKKKFKTTMGDPMGDIGYPTGFLAYDFRNGALSKGLDSNGDEMEYYSLGIRDGSIASFIGRSGCGKTTFATQAAMSIVLSFKTSEVHYFDAERGLGEARLYNLLNTVPNSVIDKKFVYHSKGITTEKFYEKVAFIHKTKLENKEEYLYNTGKFNSKGEPIYKYEPTVVVLDSVAMLLPDNLSEEEELSGSMSAAHVAKANTATIKRLIPKCSETNIILLIVNHITSAMSTGPFPAKPELSYLKPGESLPGGKTLSYANSLIVRFDDKTKLKNDKTYGIDGVLVEVTNVKTRNNLVGKPIPMVMEYNTGFRYELSLLELLKSHNKIKGAGAHLYLGDLDSVKFSYKSFPRKLMESAELQNIFREECLSILKEFVFDMDEYTKEDNTFGPHSLLEGTNY